MLPPYIIEQIRRREQEEAQEAPVIQLPLPEPRRRREQKPATEESDRGVIIIDLA
ncbi:hypothetical protein [Sandaracinus amylolyticus]|uniref:Uncharacterized protein n=1 Tax=Sandaracinus amylolyticus TaxID=927083 RepID=A0A0F6W694_9BACT|nr:hypothetical protein [Sandaracinus amylolyticus]AKF08371.1 hypothetical protein DB32_005520 [Sandaracinus amylolyticus]